MNLFLKEKVLVQREKYLYEAEITLLFMGEDKLLLSGK